MPDVDYTVERRGVIFGLLERAVHESIRDRLRENARFASGPRIAEMRGEITRALTGKLGPGAFLRGPVDGNQPLAVSPLRHVLAVRVLVTGAAEVERR